MKVLTFKANDEQLKLLDELETIMRDLNIAKSRSGAIKKACQMTLERLKPIHSTTLGITAQPKQSKPAKEIRFIERVNSDSINLEGNRK